jgi:hypothetical protein
MVEMATIRNRGEYQWEAQIRRKGYPAQRKTFETKADAQAWARIVGAGAELTHGLTWDYPPQVNTNPVKVVVREESDWVSEISATGSTRHPRPQSCGKSARKNRSISASQLLN